MLDEVRWDDLLHVYQCTDWREGEDARVTIKDERIAELFHLVENSEKAEADANLAAIHPEDVVVGQVIDARVGAPRLALGILAKDWDLFLRAPNTRVREPSRYFVVEDRSHNGMEPPSERLKQYRAIVKLVGLLERAALFLDLQHQLLVYFKDQKIEVPVFFSTEDLGSIDQDSVELLDKALHGEVHAEQRLAILDNAIADLVLSQPVETRFLYLARNVRELARRVTDGYRLFASSFSYEKIRGQVEAAQSEYVGRIHKTFVDIQGQLLGLPVATVVVATQLKPVDSWSAAAWGNIAVLIGAWLFAFLLLGSCVNQWFTLSAIHADVKRQKNKLFTSFVEISDQFSDVFRNLSTRIWWHRAALVLVGSFAVCGAVFATYVFLQLTNIEGDTEAAVERQGNVPIISDTTADEKAETQESAPPVPAEAKSDDAQTPPNRLEPN